MAVIVLSIFTLYYLLLIFFIISWSKPVGVTRVHSITIRISVVIPVRNEEHAITILLDDLVKQTYKHFEVIIVNDHSTDKTKQVVEAWMQKDNPLPLRVIELERGVYGKKKAITAAVDQARGDVIVTTDGDCRVGECWLQSITTLFSNENTKLIAGAVRLQPVTFFDEMQQLEQAALSGTTAAFIVLKSPVMCNGANLAYRKEIFYKVNGYEGNEHVASGDDEFLLKKIASRFPEGVRFNSDFSGIVTTRPARSVREFVNQRVRWAGKWRQQTFGVSSALALFIFVFHLTFLSLPMLAMFWVVSLGHISIFVLIKLLLELIWLNRITKWMGVSFNLHAFATWQFLYPPYVVFFGLISNLLRATWKGRKI